MSSALTTTNGGWEPPTHPSYIELEVNPLGAMLDIFLVDGRKPIPYASWNSSGLRWAVHVDGTADGRPGDVGCSCEIAPPLEDVVTAPHRPPRPGDRWLSSGGQRNKPGKHLRWFHPAQGLSRASVELARYGVELGLGVGGEVLGPWEILSQ